MYRVRIKIIVISTVYTIFCNVPLIYAANDKEIKAEIDVVGKKWELDEKALRESHAIDLGEALSKSKGIWKLRKGTIANDVIIRGFREKDIGYTIDGIPIYGACTARMDPALFHVNLAEIEKIEVNKGVFDLNNPPTIGGNVIIKTKKTARSPFSFNFTSDNMGYLSPSLQISFRRKNISSMFGYSYQLSKPYVSGEGKKLTEYANYKQSYIKAPAFKNHNAWFKTKVAGKKYSIGFSYSLHRAQDTLYPSLAMDSPKDGSDRATITVKQENLEINVFYNSVFHTMNNKFRKIGTFIETYSSNLSYGVKTVYQSKNLTLGAEAIENQWQAETTMGTLKQHSLPLTINRNVAFFGKIGKKVKDKLHVETSLRIDISSAKSRIMEQSVNLYTLYHKGYKESATFILPSASVILSYPLNNRFSLTLKTGIRGRFPDAQELFFSLNRMGQIEKNLGDWVGNPFLKPPINREIDLDISFKGLKLFFEGNIFYSNVVNYITLTKLATPDQHYAKSYTNTNAELYGSELSIFYNLIGYLTLKTEFSFTRGRKDDNNDPDLANIPPPRILAAVRYTKGSSFIELEAIHSFKQKYVDSYLGESVTPSYSVLNLHSRFKILKGTSINLSLENILNEHYYEHASFIRDPFFTGRKIPEPGRRIVLSLHYSYARDTHSKYR